MQNAFQPADIMLPKKSVDMKTWAVNACDQFTSEPEYWEHVTELVGGGPSTLSMILPEVYLERPDCEERLASIHKKMEQYLDEGLFDTYQNAMIYVRRTDSTGKIREGIIGCIDLDQYEYYPSSATLVRATEATVPSRIPARVRIRRGAVLELPHIMILIDDPDRQVIEPMAHEKENLQKLYDFDLMMSGGHLEGYLMRPADQQRVDAALTVLGDPETFQKKYQIYGKPVLQYAVGDGNHSLASAKAYYEQLKAAEPEKDFSHHPARYALVELVNLHSPALEFEAIHRIVTEVSREHLIAKLKETFPIQEEGEGQCFDIVTDGWKEHCVIPTTSNKLILGSLQSFLDRYTEKYGGKIDYIHGEKTLEKLSMDDYSVGFLLQDMKKEELFPTVILDGALPRKTFSMGHAQDKRYYVECRRIAEE